MIDRFGKKLHITDKKLFLLDQDGTIYNDGSLFDATPGFLKHIQTLGGRYIFITNNSSKSVDDYVRKLSAMGIACTREDFFTSAQATALYLQAHYPGKKVFCVGTKSLQEELKSASIELSDSDHAEVALMGYDTELTYQKLMDLSRLLTQKDVPYIATNPDWVCPVDFGYAPDCGSFAFMIEKATGKMPYFIGKPRPAMIELVMEKYGYQKADTVVIGDRLYTDIQSAINAGVTSICVLSGEAKLDDIVSGNIKPDYTLDSIGDIFK